MARPSDPSPQAPAGPGVLYVVATPIGNLGDVTLRALETLRAVDLIAAEDTRHSRRLLERHEIRKPMLALHEHNEREAVGRVLDRLAGGQSVSLVSDAGTPGISDPGARAIAAVAAAGYRVVPIPGPSAMAAALSVAGRQEDAFVFLGFLPPRSAARREAIGRYADSPCALVLYEAPHRVAETLGDLAELLGPRREVLIARELTKLHESIDRMALGEAQSWIAADPDRQRGEFVLVVSGAPDERAIDAASARALDILLDELPLNHAVKLAARLTGAPRNLLYQAALARREAAERKL